MSLLAAMKQKKKERLTVKHPLYQRDISMRYAYVMGVALVLATGGGISETGRVVLEKLVYAIGLPEDTLEKVIATAESAAAESIDTVVDTVLEKEEQYCLLLEMHLAALRSGAEQQREQRELIGGFGELMLLSAEEDGFLRNFAQTALEKNTSMATEVLTEGYENQLEPNFEVLKYFLPTLDYREEIEGFTLEAGQSRSITRPCIVKGPIVVKEGALLSIQGIEMILGQDCGIKSEGGQLEIRDSRFRAAEGCRDTMLAVSDMPRLVLENVCFDGEKRARAILADGGVLKANNCQFERCYDKSGGAGGSIYAKKSNLFVENCVFKDCYVSAVGGAVYVEAATAELITCTFRQCSGKDGGGGYFHQCTYTILQCEFFECEAKKNGGAICFQEAEGTIGKSDFGNCSAGIAGGGIYAYCGAAGPSVFNENNFIQCSVSDNSSGGAIDYYYGSSTIKPTVEKCSYEACKPIDVHVY